MLLFKESTLLPFLNFVTFLLLFILLCSLETLFINAQHSLIELDIWMICLVFFALHRTLYVSALFLFFSTLIFGAFSGIPYHLSLLGFLISMGFLILLKSRSFSNSSSYFTISSALAILIFHISVTSLSWVLGDHPITSPHFIKWLTSALASSGLFVLLRPLLVFIDRVFKMNYPFGFEA